VWTNNTGVQVDEGLEPHAYYLEAGLEMTDTNITNASQSTEAYWEENGTWHGSWAAGEEGAGTEYGGPYPKGETIPNCVLTIDTDWAYFYGAQPCGHNGYEPGDALPAGPVGAQMGTASSPENPEQAALQWSRKSGDPTPTIEQVGKNVPVPAVELSSEGAGKTTTRLGDTFVLHDSFRASGPVPRGDEAPAGNEMKLTIDPEDNQVVSEELK
jgi:hypothetical protein